MKKSSKKDKNFVMDGMIMNLANLNLSNTMIRAVFGCGISRICRIRRVMKNPELINRRSNVPSHAVKKADIDALKAHIATLDTEDSFPCAHRRPQKYFIEPGLTWYKIWERYERVMKETKPPRRVLSLRRWREYVKAIFPGLKLSRPKSDLCDRCVRIDIELLSPDISPEREALLKQEKAMHLADAIKHRKI